ncbi:hypothetical protein [Aphanothece sacrum]|uniref:Two-component sensor histidine kinase n=1 Tax=Aphanothece sacrum FPU1 TaxID=1920663 RepID=A0A401IMF3_APHSA|nr:hypothetical protein [Aphanothece sacrum]GBF82423.1 two-component sensor histidine kinase [Aphanothece sacrum FPU1]GBF84422.1 two-component sensor histidine kinase [Aphanothece sacrum FPU3]
MNKKSAPINQKKSSMAEQIRTIADQLKQETKIQIKATSRILGAAAQIAENHDQLIDEVVDMVNEDLDKDTSSPETILYTVNNLKQQYKTLREAKLYFDIKANSWESLANKLNHQPIIESTQNNVREPSISDLYARLIMIENDLKNMSIENNQIISLLKQILLNQDENQER